MWRVGKITKWDAGKKVYTVSYPNSQQIPPQEYTERTIIEPVIMANLGVGTKISIYSYSDNSFYDAEVNDVDDSKVDNLRADFESGMSEWIDIRRYKYHILNAPNGKVLKTYEDSNLAVISERAPVRRSATPEAVETQDLPIQPPSTTNSGDAGRLTVSRDHPFPNVRGVSGPATSNVAFVDRGTIVAIRWKRPYILYDATVVKMKDDGSQYLLQYHYDSCTKWVDLNKSEFYVIGVDATFAVANEEGPSRGTRRGARKSEGSAPNVADEPSRKRPRRSVASMDDMDMEPTETPMISVNERETNNIQLNAVKQLTVGSRIAVWSRYKEYRKATVKSFNKNREEFEIQYDADKQGRKTKISLKQNPFLILQPSDGSSFPQETSSEWENHQNPDIGLVEVGTKISVLWEGDSKFYSGKVTRMCDGEKPYYLEYDDGDVEWIDLKKNKFRIDD